MRTVCYRHGLVEGGCRDCPPSGFPDLTRETRPLRAQHDAIVVLCQALDDLTWQVVRVTSADG